MKGKRYRVEKIIPNIYNFACTYRVSDFKRDLVIGYFFTRTDARDFAFFKNYKDEYNKKSKGKKK